MARKFKVGDVVKYSRDPVGYGPIPDEDMVKGCTYSVVGLTGGDLLLKGVRQSWSAARFSLVRAASPAPKTAPHHLPDKLYVLRNKSASFLQCADRLTTLHSEDGQEVGVYELVVVGRTKTELVT